MKTELSCTLLIFLTLSCGNKSKVQVNKPAGKDSIAPKERVEETLTEPSNKDTVHVIYLNHFTISMNEDNFYEDAHFPVRPDDDTIQTVQELGGITEGAWLKVESSSIANITVEQRFETSVSLSFEGPHCDMVDWKHYLSPWKKLQPEGAIYHIDTIPDKEEARFPKVSETEFKDAIINHCGQEALQDFEGKFDIHTYPAWVGISRIYLRITGIHTTTKQPSSVILVIWVPMGC